MEGAMGKYRQILALAAGSLLGSTLTQPSLADDGERLLRLDHYIGVRSTVPAIAGQTAAIYAREVVRAGTGLRNRASANRVVLFVHGAGTPAEVSFDVPYQDYSWMESRARGFRRVRNGHDRLRPLHAAASHERPLQPVERAAARIGAGGRHRTVLPILWPEHGDDRLRLARHRRRG